MMSYGRSLEVISIKYLTRASVSFVGLGTLTFISIRMLRVKVLSIRTEKSVSSLHCCFFTIAGTSCQAINAKTATSSARCRKLNSSCPPVIVMLP